MKKRSYRKHNFAPRMMLHDVAVLKSRSRVIGRLKYSLPGLALAALVILVAWPHVQRVIYGQKPTLAETTTISHTNNAAVNPKYNGRDEKNQPYTITADQGVEASQEAIDLTRPKMVMNLKTGDVVTLTSASGRLNKITNQLNLVGNVTLTHSLGYVLETTQAWIDCKEGSAQGHDPVWGNGPSGAIEAQGFALTDQGTKVRFIGGTQLLLKTKAG